MNRDRKVALWEAINRYVVACGGDPAALVYGNTSRQEAVADVESVVRLVERDINASNRARPAGVDAHPATCRNCEQGGHPDFCGPVSGAAHPDHVPGSGFVPGPNTDPWDL